ncbi:alpha/beta hydrolase [Brevibacillus nitrificans]|uniref:Alpha/beta hydrolase n=1 Tax=Brevibacillus nitrificans TaxID=651560 RepID=A0A3M8CUT4_9BACL|nr:alpha/beta hydrolase [Brevibacillus nitrificans]RNB79151.1 alpha/beta hydrolase [Brevibacillus nitrificans]
MRSIENQSTRLERGATPLYASQFDQRFSYCAYIPSYFAETDPLKHSLLVVIHGTERSAQLYRDEFKQFSEETGAVILAPLFPAGIGEPGELNSYKMIKYRDIRFDHVLLAMIQELTERYGISGEKFLLFGFSGGGQFVHRFYYLHPDRLLAVSVAAPGNVTLLDPSMDWFTGIRDFEEQFGTDIKLEEMSRVPVQLVIGSEDNRFLEVGRDSPFWLPGVEIAGNTRLERIRTLRKNWASQGIQIRYEEVPGVGHEGMKLLHAVKAFFAGALNTD